MNFEELFISFLLIGLEIGILAGVTLFIRPAVHRIAGANWSYFLWPTLLVPLLMAILPGSLFSTLPRSESLDWLAYQTSAIVSQSAGLAWLPIVAAVWFSGTAYSLAKLWLQYLKLRLEVMDSLVLPSSRLPLEVQEACTEIGIFPPPQVRVSPDIMAPAIIGIVRPILIVPLAFVDRYSALERRLILRHELIHFKRRDPYWNLLFRLFRCLFWFVPMLRLAERRFRDDQERSCDRAVIFDEPRNVRAEYAAALLKTVSSNSQSVQLASFLNTRSDLINRTAAIAHHRRSVPNSVIGVCILAMAVVATTLITPQISASDIPPTSLTGWCSIYAEIGL